MDNYYLAAGLNRLKSMGIDANEILWKNEIVQNPGSIPNYEYWEFSHSSENQIVETGKIVGTHHCDYYGKSWIEMLGCLKRAKFLTKESALRWSVEKQWSISLNDFGGAFYIAGDGNHRVCISKFLGFSAIETGHVNHYRFNQARFDFDKMLNQRAIEMIDSDNHIAIVDLGDVKIRLDYYSDKKFFDFFDSVEVSKWVRFKSRYFSSWQDIISGHYDFEGLDAEYLRKAIIAYKLNRSE